MEENRLHLLVSGRVQGVWYRASTREKARDLGLRGWVRNLPDGRVEILAEGPRPALEALLGWCRRGPPLARVEGVEATWGPAEGGFEGFATLR
jgi:acylphosphatase